MEENNKSSIIAFRVTPEERAWIEKQSYGNYRRISDFVRDCVLKKDIVIVKGLDEFSLELRRIGNNLNQLTRAVNAGYVRAVDLTKTEIPRQINASVLPLPISPLRKQRVMLLFFIYTFLFIR